MRAELVYVYGLLFIDYSEFSDDAAAFNSFKSWSAVPLFFIVVSKFIVVYAIVLLEVCIN